MKDKFNSIKLVIKINSFFGHVKIKFEFVKTTTGNHINRVSICGAPSH